MGLHAIKTKTKKKKKIQTHLNSLGLQHSFIHSFFISIKKEEKEKTKQNKNTIHQKTIKNNKNVLEEKAGKPIRPEYSLPNWMKNTSHNYKITSKYDKVY